MLSGDLTIVAKNFTSTNGLQVKRAAGLPPETTPVLRVVVPMADGTLTCAANGTAGKITMNSGGTVLGSDVSLLIYSAGSVDMSNSISLYGQMYACTVPELKNSVTITYRSVGGSAPATPGSSSGTGSTPLPASTWSLTDVRDVSRP